MQGVAQEYAAAAGSPSCFGHGSPQRLEGSLELNVQGINSDHADMRDNDMCKDQE